jgi:hypothetical protein
LKKKNNELILFLNILKKNDNIPFALFESNIFKNSFFSTSNPFFDPCSTPAIIEFKHANLCGKFLSFFSNIEEYSFFISFISSITFFFKINFFYLFYH